MLNFITSSLRPGCNGCNYMRLHHHYMQNKMLMPVWHTTRTLQRHTNWHDIVLSHGSRPGWPVTNDIRVRVRVVQPVPKAYRKWCVKFRTTPSVQTGFPAVIQHSLSEHLKCLTWKSKTWNDLTSANLFVLERRMRSAAKRVEQSLVYGYLSKMEWVSLRSHWQHV